MRQAAPHTAAQRRARNIRVRMILVIVSHANSGGARVNYRPGALLLRAMYAASASKSTSLISVLRKNGIIETPFRTNVFVTAGIKSVRSLSRAGLAPLYLASKATVPGKFPGP